MLKTLKFSGKNSDFFFGGCYHHHHNPNWPVPLWKQRGFDSIEKHDLRQIKKWNETCDENSIIFLLGDTIFHDSTGENLKKFINQLRFKELFLMPGNHFSGYLQNYKQVLGSRFFDAVSENGEILYEVYPLSEIYDYNKKIYYVPNYYEIQINGLPIILSHYRIFSWNKMARESLMLHSHQHLANSESDLLETKFGKVADLGYETLLKYNDGAPISLEKLKKYMDKKSYKKEGHH